jgi:competence protein ComEA
MRSPPPFVLPAERGWRSAVLGLLQGAGRQRRAVAIVVAVALLGTAAVWLRGTPRPADGAAPGGGVAQPAAVTLPRAAPGAPADGEVTVDVTGRVRHPGVMRLPPGSRVLDAVQAAGGALPGADLDALNLARRLVDGEQVRVPVPGERPAGEPGQAGKGAPASPVNLNTATLEELDALPGVGQATAQRIIAYRSAHPFASVEELRHVPGIGERRFADLKDLVTV